MNETVSKPCVLGLTGGIGAGKSTITNYLRSKDIPVFDCDAYVATLYEDREFVDALEEKYGWLGDDPKAGMAALVVKDPTILDQLKPIFQSELQEAIRYFKMENGWYDFLIIDAPLLFENNLEPQCDFTITVSAPEEIRRARVMSRPGMTAEKLDLIISRQMNDWQRETRADYMITNHYTVEFAKQQLDAILKMIEEARRAA